MDRHRVLFVCMGNICRSPAGEGLFENLVREKGIAHQFVIDSAGTIGYHSGNSADSRMMAAAKKRGITLTSRARQVTQCDLADFGLVVAMDQNNLNHLKNLDANPFAEVRLFSDFCGDQWPTDVPDPYYGENDGFEFVLDMIQEGCPNILKHLQKNMPSQAGN